MHIHSYLGVKQIKEISQRSKNNDLGKQMIRMHY
jgi:hypothetical protein